MSFTIAMATMRRPLVTWISKSVIDAAEYAALVNRCSHFAPLWSKSPIPHGDFRSKRHGDRGVPRPQRVTRSGEDRGGEIRVRLRPQSPRSPQSPSMVWELRGLRVPIGMSPRDL